MTHIELQAHTTAVLRKAADLVEQGWCQKYAARDQFGNETLIDGGDDVAWCALGAIACAASRLRQSSHETMAVEAKAEIRLMQTLDLAGAGYVARWNDAPERAAAQVAEALREAAGVK